MRRFIASIAARSRRGFSSVGAAVRDDGLLCQRHNSCLLVSDKRSCQCAPRVCVYVCSVVTIRCTLRPLVLYNRMFVWQFSCFTQYGRFPPNTVNVAEYIGQRKVVLLGLPGAFTPT